MAFVFEDRGFTITLRGSLHDGPVFSYAVLPYDGSGEARSDPPPGRQPGPRFGGNDPAKSENGIPVILPAPVQGSRRRMRFGAKRLEGLDRRPTDASDRGGTEPGRPDPSGCRLGGIAGSDFVLARCNRLTAAVIRQTGERTRSSPPGSAAHNPAACRPDTARTTAGAGRTRACWPAAKPSARRRPPR